MSDQRDRPPSGDHQENADKQPQILFDTLRRTPYIPFLVLGYASIALSAWVVECILIYKPIGARSYDFKEYVSDISEIFSKSDRYLRSARTLQSVASVLTIPLTSTICSCAAVAFLQRQPKRGRQGPTLRQSMVLADKSWMDPVLITKLVTGGWKQYGSLFLLVAILLHLLGASIMPLESILLTSKTIKVPSNYGNSTQLIDLAGMIKFEEGQFDDGQSTVDLRSRLASVGRTDPQFRLWSTQPGCVRSPSSESTTTFCAKAGQYTFESTSRIRDPFWAPLPSDFNTGLIQQFAPRVNFTSKYESIPTDAFPQNCDQISDALFLHYENMTVFGGYAVDVCMPENVTQSRWKAQRSRQDFSEELYVKMKLTKSAGMFWDDSFFVPGDYALKVTLNTTAGYFELPNYMNGQQPGPVLDDGPKLGHYQDFPDLNDISGYGPESIPRNVNMTLAYPMNKGPLLSTALALFGPGSYLDIRHTVARAYEGSPIDVWGGCIAIVPFINLLSEPGVSLSIMAPLLGPCLSGEFAKTSDLAIVVNYIWLFAANIQGHYPTARRLQEAFAAAAFLAVDVMYGGGTTLETMHVSWEPGDDRQIPYMSRGGIVLISSLLGLFLLCLLTLSLYSAWTPRWTDQLDSFALMRIGASIHDHLPFKLANYSSKVKSLDELAGWIGEVPHIEGDEVDRVGELGLGARMPLKRGRKYHCYAVDDPVHLDTDTQTS